MIRLTGDKPENCGFLSPHSNNKTNVLPTFQVVMGRYTENTEPISDSFKNRYRPIPTSVFGIPKNTEYRQLNTERSVLFGILVPSWTVNFVHSLLQRCKKICDRMPLPCGSFTVESESIKMGNVRMVQTVF